MSALRCLACGASGVRLALGVDRGARVSGICEACLDKAHRKEGGGE